LELDIERKRNDLMHEFISNTSHHMRTPITIVQSTLDLCYMKMERYRKDMAKTSEFGALHDLSTAHMADMEKRMATVSEAIGTLTNVVTEMLEYSRLEAEHTYTFKTFDLARLTEETGTVFKTRAATHDLTCHVHVPPGRVPVYASRTHIQQALEKVLDNAIRYTKAGGVVKISLNTDDEVATITVTDTGMGIQKDRQAHIFQTFYRTDRAMQRYETGVGMGLAYVRRVIERHNGTIIVSSNPGKGAIFRLMIPMTE
ncbi:MAG: HAMP domain-containing sensor histidine kinase, partial [Chloroflexota bacterium]